MRLRLLASAALIALAFTTIAAPVAQARQGFAIPLEGWAIDLMAGAGAAAGATVAHHILKETATDTVSAAVKTAKTNRHGKCHRKCKKVRAFGRAFKKYGGDIYRWAKDQGGKTVKAIVRWFAKRFGRHHVKRTVISAVKSCLGWGVFDFLVIRHDWDTARNGCLGGGAAAVAAGGRKTMVAP